MTVGPGSVFIIFLIVILIISLVVVFPVFSNISRNKCIMQQWALINNFDRIMNVVKEQGGAPKDKSLLVMGCAECIWYDSMRSRWAIRVTDEEEATYKPASYRVLGVADGCDDCNSPENCANLLKERTYNFKVGVDYVNCTDCPDSPNLVDCVDYEDTCDEQFDGRRTGYWQCAAYPTGSLEQRDWLGNQIGPSARAVWAGGLCLKSPKIECTDYTECGLYTTSFQGNTKAHYACSSIGGDPVDRCCSPLLSTMDLGMSTWDDPAAACTYQFECEIYCENIRCGEVYDDIEGAPTDSDKIRMCCEPNGEKCIGRGRLSGYSWECCVYDDIIEDSTNFLPSRCLDNTGDTCDAGEDCSCCIGAGYGCVPGIRDVCCGQAVCTDVGGTNKCCLNAGEACSRNWQCCSGTCSGGTCS